MNRLIGLVQADMPEKFENRIASLRTDHLPHILNIYSFAVSHIDGEFLQFHFQAMQIQPDLFE
jgi:hypothetical protein